MEERKDELLHNSFNNTLEQKEVRQKKKILTQIIKLILIFLSPFLELLIRFIFFPKKIKIYAKSVKKTNV